MSLHYTPFLRPITEPVPTRDLPRFIEDISRAIEEYPPPRGVPEFSILWLDDSEDDYSALQLNIASFEVDLNDILSMEYESGSRETSPWPSFFLELSNWSPFNFCLIYRPPKKILRETWPMVDDWLVCCAGLYQLFPTKQQNLACRF